MPGSSSDLPCELDPAAAPKGNSLSGFCFKWGGLSLAQEKCAKNFREFFPNTTITPAAETALSVLPIPKVRGQIPPGCPCPQYTAWVKQDLLPRLPENPVIVMDNATFHKPRKISSGKQGIPCSSCLLIHLTSTPSNKNGSISKQAENNSCAPLNNSSKVNHFIWDRLYFTCLRIAESILTPPHDENQDF